MISTCRIFAHLRRSSKRAALRVCAAIAISVLTHFGVLRGQEKTAPLNSPRQVEIAGSQSLTINSAIVGREYDLYVELPRFYEDTTKSFPVVYVLDGQWDFSLAQALYGQQYFDGFVPGLIVVGIAWGGQSPNYDSLRAADLTPTKSKQVPQSGNAPKFLGFIKNELIPYIDSKYRTMKSGRTIMGSSYGGLFTLYALFQEPDLFSRYVAASPAIGFDDGVIKTFEKRYAESSPSIPVRLFMAEGGLEGGVADFQEFVKHLQEPEYKTIQLDSKILYHIGHSGSKAEGFTRGLQWAFDRPSLTLDQAILKQYVGTYETQEGIRLRISEDHGLLSLHYPGTPEIQLLAENENTFYHLGMFLTIRFKKNESGKTVGLDAEQFSGTSFLKKTD